MPTEWEALRSWSGSRERAFEMLCCQLAEAEPCPTGSTYTRVGTPDGGVESYHVLPNGDEWGWQAKYFIKALSDGQWRQIDKSVKRALDTHPRLVRYVVSTAYDLSGEASPKGRSQREKWDGHISKWRGWAAERGLTVTFEYWGEHEIVSRLGRDEHRGRFFFWFHKEVLHDAWFENHVAGAIANAGPRYTPELSIDLPVARLFEGLGRTDRFRLHVDHLCGQVMRALVQAHSKSGEEVAGETYARLRAAVQGLCDAARVVKSEEVRHVDWDSVRQNRAAWDIAIACRRQLEEEEVRRRETGKAEPPHYAKADFGYEMHHLQQLLGNLRKLSELAESPDAMLTNVPALLLIGDAGTGKTHLFCDIAKQRAAAGVPTVVIHGRTIRDEEPWSQIIRELGLSCKRPDQFLGALNAAGQARGVRALILIDALNESENRGFWRTRLPGMLTDLQRYPYVGLAVSVRTSYQKLVIAEGLIPNRLVLAEHYGFCGQEYNAAKHFFAHYGIEFPSVPLLVPEFSKPLFLKLFCKGLHNRGMTRLPPGIHGVTQLFAFFIDSVNEKLSDERALNYDPKEGVVTQALSRLAGKMAKKLVCWLPRDEARSLVGDVLPGGGYRRSLFWHLITEGVIDEDVHWTQGGQHQEVVRFSYERLGDHLVAEALLDRHLTKAKPGACFSSRKTLGRLVKDEQTACRNCGLVRALSVQLPERTGKELHQLAPRTRNWEPTRHAFIESLVWRERTAVTAATSKYLNETLAKPRFDDVLLNTLLTIAAVPQHPYNADALHRYLMRQPMAERDTWWSTWLHYQHGERGAVDRLVEWALSRKDKAHISDDSIRLTGTAVAWFLTTSNRFLRDRATKALVSLFEDRVPVLTDVLNTFAGVNDPYVLERLYAIAYACAMRSRDGDALAVLGEAVYRQVFEKGNPPAHVLLRDYARGVIEVALSRGVNVRADLGKVRPPYKSEWPRSIPSTEELEKHGKREEGIPGEEWARLAIHSSVTGHGDFYRYVLNRVSWTWTSHPLGGPRGPSPKEVYEHFVSSLTKRQREAWDLYSKARDAPSTHALLLLARLGPAQSVGSRGAVSEASVKALEKTFRKTLRGKKLETFRESVLPYLQGQTTGWDQFDLSLASRWVLKRVFDLGWTVRRFGAFDRSVSRYAVRGIGAKAERIGKKYQWLAYHELLARIGDNFQMREDQHSPGTAQYEGPWQVGARDIDPSCLLADTARDDWEPCSPLWHSPVTCNAWDAHPNGVKWLKSKGDLPDPRRLILVTCPKDGAEWLALGGYYTWEEATPPDQDRFDVPTKHIWCHLRSYLVKRENLGAVFNWAKRQDFMGSWMPESDELTSVFLGEFFWSPAFAYHDCPYWSHEGWTRGREGQIPAPVLVTTDEYLWDTGRDCSAGSAIKVFLPSRQVVERMGLSWSGEEGRFLDADGELAAMDPSGRLGGPGVLAVARRRLQSLLDERGYAIFWTVLGQKQILGGRSDDRKGDLTFSGAYRLYRGAVTGTLTSWFEGPGQMRRERALANPRKAAVKKKSKSGVAGKAKRGAASGPKRKIRKQAKRATHQALSARKKSSAKRRSAP